MKKLLGTAVLFAAVTFGVSNASANPCVSEGFCRLFDGNGNFTSGNDVKTHIEITPSGIVNFWCKADVTKPSSGNAAIFNFTSTKGEFCFLGCDSFGIPTKDWQEVVSASGEATLQCHLKLQ